ncbi:MAG: hypothetical protein SGILL_004460 [Bacillariaceae sp.]
MIIKKDAITAMTSAVVKKDTGGKTKNGAINFEKRSQKVLALALEENWTCVGLFEEFGLICFSRGESTIAYYLETGTLACTVNQEIAGKCKIYHRQPGWNTIEKIFHAVSHGSDDMCCRRGTGAIAQCEPVLGNRRWYASHEIGEEFATAKANVDETAVVALGKSWFIGTCFGKYHFGNDVPRKFHSKLKGRQDWRAHVDIAVFGGDGASFFLRFVDGEIVYNKLAKELEEALEEDSDIQTLALGPYFSFFCVWSDGKTLYEGLMAPVEKALINTDGKTIDEVTFGPTNEFFVRFTNGDWKAGGYHWRVDQIIDEIEREKQKAIVHIAFGSNYDFLITYE